MSDSKMTAIKIVCSTGMSGRPEFFSGRGATLADLDGNRLFAIYNKIMEEIGEAAAKEFVTMIENIDCLSATNFLNCLYSLEANNWTYIPAEQSNIDLGSDTPGRDAIAFASLFSSLFSSGDATDCIRNSFFKLINHPIKEEILMDGTKNSYLG